MSGFLLQACAILLLPLLVWWPLRHHLPLVLAQILCGLALGSTVLGLATPELYQALFPAGSAEKLQPLAALAMVCVAAIAGMHLDLAGTVSRLRPLALIATASFAGPALVGALLALLAQAVDPAVLGPRGTPTLFAACGALCLAVTALPVLAAILRECGWLETRLGRTALAAAAGGDLLLWLLLSLLLVAATPGAALGPALLAQLGGLAVMAVTLAVVRRTLPVVDGTAPLSTVTATAAVATIFAASALTEALHLHSAVGAFVAGATLPRPIARRLLQMLEPTTWVLLLPFFFFGAGLNADFSQPLGWLVAISVVAGSLAKIGATAVAARLAGWAWIPALQLGALMQSRGLMELVLLSVLLEAGLISACCFASLVLMALISTAMTMPLARWLGRPRVSAEAAIAD